MPHTRAIMRCTQGSILTCRPGMLNCGTPSSSDPGTIGVHGNGSDASAAATKTALTPAGVRAVSKERVRGFEPLAACLGSRCATTALHPHGAPIILDFLARCKFGSRACRSLALGLSARLLAAGTPGLSLSRSRRTVSSLPGGMQRGTPCVRWSPQSGSANTAPG